MNHFFFMLIVLVMMASAGCASLLVANPSTRQTSGSSTSSSDSRITNAVNAALVRERSISSLDVYVSTHNGVVTLKGYVASQALKNRAGQVAASSRGVKSVRNQLRIK